MTTNEAIKNTLDMCKMVLSQYIGDMSDKELMMRPVPGANHIAWQLGHLIASEWNMMSGAGYKMPALPDGFVESYTPETATSDDPAKFHKKREYLDLAAKLRTATLAALAKESADGFDKPSPEAMRDYAPTIGAVYNLVGMHDLMHAGQFAVLRRKLGKPVLF